MERVKNGGIGWCWHLFFNHRMQQLLRGLWRKLSACVKRPKHLDLWRTTWDACHSEKGRVQGVIYSSGKCRCWWKKKACGSLVYTEESLFTEILSTLKDYVTVLSLLTTQRPLFVYVHFSTLLLLKCLNPGPLKQDRLHQSPISVCHIHHYSK